MEAPQDPLLKNILDAPVGQVESTLRDQLQCDVYLDIIEQNQLEGTNFIRKITITANELPVVRATVKFDSNLIPDNIVSELLRKKDGIGTILSRNNIKADREIASLDFENDGNKIIRKYRIIYNDSVWFEISEEMRLDYIHSSKNS